MISPPNAGEVVEDPVNRHPPVFVLDSLRNTGKPVLATWNLGPRLSIPKRPFPAERVQFADMSSSPVESFAYIVLKRIFDVFFAVFGVVILSPLLLAIAFLVKLSSPGPILFKQERIGRHTKRFTMLKFRTMHCSSTVESDTTWTTMCDPRCTTFGAVLRKFSLDELPQLFNVIRGEMSLVGPRPERPHFVAKFRNEIQRYDMRHCCHVGITGWAQVNGLRGDTSIPDRVQCDLQYLFNWSLAWDVRIILRTIALLKNESGC
jgi:exopolysaccharide biosynthesis polyprenyl glycosylphosphotransferase